MASLGQVFDATQVDPSKPRSFMPAGRYPAHVLKSDVMEAKVSDKNPNGTNKFVWMEIEVTAGEFAGNTLETRFNLWNSNDKAVEIASRDFSALCHAVGKLQPSDTTELHYLPFVVIVKVKPAVYEPDGITIKYNPQSEVSGYEAMPAGGASAVRSPSASAAQQPAAPQGGGNPPPPPAQRQAAPPPPAAANKPAGAPWHAQRAA